MTAVLLALVPSLAMAMLSWYLAVAGSRDALPRNAIVGLRLAATTRTEEAWYAANRAAVPSNIGAGIWFALGGLAAGFLASPEGGRAIAMLAGWAIGFVWVAIAVVAAVRAANALDAEQNGP